MDLRLLLAFDFASGLARIFDFYECFAHKLSDGGLAKTAVSCKAFTYIATSNLDCTGGAVPPVPASLPDGMMTSNAANFSQLVAPAAVPLEFSPPLTCWCIKF